MTDELDDLRQRLVVGRKRDGRCVYDEAAKAQLVALCKRPGVSVARLARECGVNANQVSRWLREQGTERGRVPAAAAAPSGPAFIALPLARAPTQTALREDGMDSVLLLQARLPNGVAIDLRGVELRHVGEVIEAFGRLACSVSTSG